MSVTRLLPAGAASYVAAALSALCVTAPRPAAAQLSPDVHVRIYDAVRLSAATLATARRLVEDTFNDAHLRVGWRECEGTPARCDEAVSAGEMVIRLIKAPPPVHQDVRRLPLGESVLAAPSEPSTFASVYPDRVRHLADRADVPLGVPLGYAIAHELAHLLLRSRVHTTHGLMRAHWTPVELRHQRKPDWQLLAHERQLVSAAAEERGAPRAARLTP